MGTDPRTRRTLPTTTSARTAAPRRRRRPARSAELVSEVLGRLGGSGRALEFRVFDCYSRVVGEALRTRTMPERLAGTTLFMRATSSALAHELTLLRADILERMAAEMGQGIVLELRTRVGRIPRRRPSRFVDATPDDARLYTVACRLSKPPSKSMRPDGRRVATSAQDYPAAR